MKFATTLSVLAGFAAAAPTQVTQVIEVESRQLSTISNDLESGSSSNCPDAILIFARGSTELGNMGSSVGPELADGLDDRVGDVWVQGVGGAYGATLAGNTAPRGSPELSIREGVRLFQLAQSKCPGTPVVAGGYSQGAALIAAAVSDLSGATQEQVKGVTLFGYTKNQQNGGRIPNYPTDRTKVFCALGDLVCEGTLIVVAPHLTYNDDARGPGAEFLASKI